MRTARFGNCHFDALGRGGDQVNKFEQVSSDDHQMSLAGGGYVQKRVGWYVQRDGYVAGGKKCTIVLGFETMYVCSMTNKNLFQDILSYGDLKVDKLIKI